MSSHNPVGNTSTPTVLAQILSLRWLGKGALARERRAHDVHVVAKYLTGPNQQTKLRLVSYFEPALSPLSPSLSLSLSRHLKY